MRWWLSLAVVGMAAALQVVGASRILVLAPISSKSHKNFYMGVISALAAQGHQITLLTPYKASKAKENVREVVLRDMDVSNILPNLFAGNKMSGPLQLLQKAPYLCSDALARPETQNLLKEEFDMAMVSMFMSDCFLSIVHQLKIPYAFIFPAGLMGPIARSGGSISLPSFAHNPLFTYKHPYSFTERLIIALSDVASDLVFNQYLSYQTEKVCRQRGLCPEDMPNFSEIRQNSSLTLVNALVRFS